MEVLRDVQLAEKEGRYSAAARLCGELKDCDVDLYNAHADLVARVQAGVRLLNEAKDALYVPAGLQCVRAQGPISVFEKSNVVEGHDGILFDSILDSPMNFLCVVLKETLLYPKWNPIVTDCCNTPPHDGANASNVRSVWMQLCSPLPLFLQDRDACVTARVLDCLDESPRSLYVVFSDTDPVPLKEGCKPHTARMRVRMGFLRISCVRTGCVRVTGALAADYGVYFTPVWLQRQLVSTALCAVIEAWAEHARLAEKAYKEGNKSGNMHASAVEKEHAAYMALFRRLSSGVVL